MRYNNFAFVLISILTISVFTSCSKDHEIEKLVGSWDVVFLSAAESNQQVVWSIGEEGKISTTIFSTDTFYVDEGTYTLEREKISRFYLNISNLGTLGYYDGTWRILKLTKKVLIMVRVKTPDGETQGAYLYKEFVKSE